MGTAGRFSPGLPPEEEADDDDVEGYDDTGLAPYSLLNWRRFQPPARTSLPHEVFLFFLRKVVSLADPGPQTSRFFRNLCFTFCHCHRLCLLLLRPLRHHVTRRELPPCPGAMFCSSMPIILSARLVALW
ncbi:unnamed protein product [Prorocentrum cordatum]|uniref:Uncharacterized protein n=1 Tax=Prorocentrum cordatum TaxID=2364126 RepID=A0ABN9SMG4_9DINO|nr:unnamed protein product [Polarella glacialis]